MRILTNKILGFDDNGVSLHYIEAGGLSTEEKPDETDAGGKIVNTSICQTIDDGMVYEYSEELVTVNGTPTHWVPQFSFQS